ncbi:hypothetical protein [Pedobacter puniceum]|jgi:hypothetical protein|uniref:Uncharacterized protein n=1 Tax=Pedobacter puniceum TaxID=2666136 RepID=A0A7K0FM71_9SPHI|nr:hypothetical protein [Pedobacter puniceum]MRX47069.1 hypothetical protein [Pedobacter puniceum]
MFEKLYSIVKENLEPHLNEVGQISVSAHEAIINEASGTIIDVLKAQIDNGKFNDLLAFFSISSIDNTFLVRSIASKYAIRLNKYYGINIHEARAFADKQIPVVMNKFIRMAKDNPKSANGMFAFFNKLSGYTVNFETLFGKMPQFQLA